MYCDECMEECPRCNGSYAATLAEVERLRAALLAAQNHMLDGDDKAISAIDAALRTTPATPEKP